MEKTKKTVLANKLFLIIFALLILGSIAATYIKFAVLKDYQIVAETTCDPLTEKCFMYICDQTVDDTCPIQEEERITYYKIISKKAATIAQCEATTEKIGCNEELTCTPGEMSCSYTYCDLDNLVEENMGHNSQCFL